MVPYGGGPHENGRIPFMPVVTQRAWVQTDSLEKRMGTVEEIGDQGERASGGYWESCVAGDSGAVGSDAGGVLWRITGFLGSCAYRNPPPQNLDPPLVHWKQCNKGANTRPMTNRRMTTMDTTNVIGRLSGYGVAQIGTMHSRNPNLLYSLPPT